MRTRVAAVSPSTCSVLLAWSQRQQRPELASDPPVAVLAPLGYLSSRPSSLGFLYTPVSSTLHPRHLWSSQTPRITSPPLLPAEVFGEGGTPVAPSLHFLLRLHPFNSVVLNPLPIAGCFDRSGLNLEIGVFHREHPSSSPAPVSAPPDSLLR